MALVNNTEDDTGHNLISNGIVRSVNTEQDLLDDSEIDSGNSEGFFLFNL